MRSAVAKATLPVVRERKGHGSIAPLREVREARDCFLPVKAPRVDNYTVGRRRVDAKRHNGAPEAPCSKGVVNLENDISKSHLMLKLSPCIMQYIYEAISV